jgi:primary-amine oxidase
LRGTRAPCGAAGRCRGAAGGSRTADRRPHPLDALTAEEIVRVVAALRAAGRIDADAKFATLAVTENDKAAVRAWRPGEPFARRAFAVVKQGAAIHETIVEVASGSVESWREIEGKEPRVLLSETDGRETLWADADWRAAMQKRGYDADAPIFCAPLAPGPALPPEHADRRILHFSCYDVAGPEAFLFGRPIEGLMAVVDVNAQEVLAVVDLGVIPMPTDASSLRYEDSARYRPRFEPIEIVTPSGSNIRIEGSLVHWDNWDFHLRVDQRVGPVVSLVTYDDRGTKRDVLYQLAVSEMYVPYMDPDATWSWKAYMDVGEYGFGLLASALEPGADCPASAHFLDQTIAADDGRAFVLPNAVCVFERPTGAPLWRHVGEGTAETRANVELVVRMAPVVGNYDYIIDYAFDRAGDIEVRAGAAGIDAVKAVAAQTVGDTTAERDTAYGTMIGKGLVGINHDHYISFRVDIDVDGPVNRAVFDRFEVRTLPSDNRRRSLWTVESHTIATAGPLEHEVHDGFLRIESTGRRNDVGYPTSYQLYPGHAVSVLSADDPIQRRAD